jgi:hypothetical protein
VSNDLLNAIILAGGSGGLGPALYELGTVAGFGPADEHPEEPQPFRFAAGCPPCWWEIWLGAD